MFDIFEPEPELAPRDDQRDDWDGTIRSGLFVQSEQGRWQLQLVVEPDDGGEEQVFKLGVGKAFASFDGGETIAGPKMESKFNARTGYWRWIKACMDAGAKDELSARNKDEHGPLHADFWDGLRFHYSIVYLPAEKPNPDTPDGRPWVKIEGGRPTVLPDRFLGVGDVQLNGGITADDRAALSNLASGAVDHQDFMSQVSTSSLAKNKDVVVRLADPKFYAELKS